MVKARIIPSIIVLFVSALASFGVGVLLMEGPSQAGEPRAESIAADSAPSVAPNERHARTNDVTDKTVRFRLSDAANRQIAPAPRLAEKPEPATEAPSFVWSHLAAGSLASGNAPRIGEGSGKSYVDFSDEREAPAVIHDKTAALPQ